MCVLSLFLLAFFWNTAWASPCDGLPRGEVLIPKPGSGFWRIPVEIATTPKSRRRGLMFRRHLPSGHGMLLCWRRPRYIAIWMKNTYIPLDIVFIGKGGRITHVHRGARPLDTTIIPSRKPVIAVLEVPAGDARRFRLRPGVRLRLPKHARAPSCP